MKQEKDVNEAENIVAVGSTDGLGDDPVEWEFGVPASQVDIGRIQSECLEADVFSRASYVLALERNAPVTFARYRDKYLGGVKRWGRAKSPNDQVESARFGELKLSGCENHPHRLDLSCCKIRQTDGTALTTKQVWEVISELADAKHANVTDQLSGDSNQKPL